MNLQPMYPSPVPGQKVICVACCRAVDARGVLADLDGAPFTFYCLACLWPLLEMAELYADARRAALRLVGRVVVALERGSHASD